MRVRFKKELLATCRKLIHQSSSSSNAPQTLVPLRTDKGMATAKYTTRHPKYLKPLVADVALMNAHPMSSNREPPGSTRIETVASTLLGSRITAGARRCSSHLEIPALGCGFAEVWTRRLGIVKSSVWATWMNAAREGFGFEKLHMHGKRTLSFIAE